jgi:hypothetical protein
MASHGDASSSGSDGSRNSQTTSGRLITQSKISRQRRFFNGEMPMGPNPTEDEVAALRFIISE